MSGPSSNPSNANGNGNGNGIATSGPFGPLTTSDSHIAVNNNNNDNNNDNNNNDGGDVSPRRVQSSSQHIRLPDHLNRPHLTAKHRSLSDALRAVRSREEQETLLGPDEEIVDPDGCVRGEGGLMGPREIFHRDPHKDLEVYYTIHRIRRVILAAIDDPYTMDQLKEPRMNVLVVKPLVEKLWDEDDVSVVYCLLVNRMQFLREQHFQHHHQTVNLTRANLCELIAMKLLRKHDEESTGRAGLLLLANILVAPFQPFQNAPPGICPERHNLGYFSQGGYEGKMTALEVAIISESKMFLASSASQKIIDAVYRGRVVYTPTSFLDIIPDHYKHKPISLYDPRKAPLLNQYRLIVPRTRNIIEVAQFTVLIGLFCLCMMNRENTLLTTSEIWFIVYAAGWSVDECSSMLEHGWAVHTQNLWAFLDITFVIIYTAYMVVRIHGWKTGSVEEARQALDILAIVAPILFPRLAFNLLPENMLFISLRAMMKEFLALTLIAVWCFGGFLLALKWLSMGNDKVRPEDSPNPVTISKWMLWIWFGLDGTGIQEAPAFHEFLGPALMVIYAFLGNTLFLTILLAILSNTFSKIAADATAEIQFRRAVMTFEGVKSGAIFAYRPPFNILAIFFLLPLKFILSPRWFHKINITIVRILNAPMLLLIALYERRYLWKPARRRTLGPTRRSKWGLNWNDFSVHADLQAVFDEEPPQEIIDKIDEEDEVEWSGTTLEQSFGGTRSRSMSPGGMAQPGVTRRRRLSSVWQG
ncbi:hypothetical protein K504DRAFT_442209 [Pleomassaria siparia CBS 279.74]|uniref:Nonselective cation channel n=1 Tax=Pleomassaria siparia CBS 279.74 TaxID=1314801 RepID=A0A6G1JV30_9PLEO|nr:hypothetical protein K504DRAFT_442209 [Pleomassaria siparia CBS 279.74]